MKVIYVVLLTTFFYNAFITYIKAAEEKEDIPQVIVIGEEGGEGGEESRSEKPPLSISYKSFFDLSHNSMVLVDKLGTIVDYNNKFSLGLMSSSPSKDSFKGKLLNIIEDDKRYYVQTITGPRRQVTFNVLEYKDYKIYEIHMLDLEEICARELLALSQLGYPAQFLKQMAALSGEMDSTTIHFKHLVTSFIDIVSFTKNHYLKYKRGKKLITDFFASINTICENQEDVRFHKLTGDGAMLIFGLDSQCSEIKYGEEKRKSSLPVVLRPTDFDIDKEAQNTTKVLAAFTPKHCRMTSGLKTSLLDVLHQGEGAGGSVRGRSGSISVTQGTYNFDELNPEATALLTIVEIMKEARRLNREIGYEYDALLGREKELLKKEEENKGELEELAGQKKELQFLMERPLQLRYGLNSGEAEGMIIGWHFDVIDQSINLASRMESYGEPNIIQVTPKFVIALDDKLKRMFPEVKSVIIEDVKGFGRVKAYRSLKLNEIEIELDEIKIKSQRQMRRDMQVQCRERSGSEPI